MSLFAKIFKRRKYRGETLISLENSIPISENETNRMVSPYVEQIQEFMEEHLLAEDEDLEPVHNLNRWLLSHPEFLPDVPMES